MNVAAIVVAYFPDQSMVRNLGAIAAQVERIYLIDNSPAGDLLRQFPSLEKNLCNLSYLPQGTNTGIADALNTGCRRAIQDGFEWVMTFDQDSLVADGMVQNLKGRLSGDDSHRIAIVAPLILDSGDGTPLFDAGRVELHAKAPSVVITSGNLLRLQAWKAVGGFDSLLFIDCVDFDFCFRLRNAGWRVDREPRAQLFHRLGETREWKILGLRARIRTYSGFRRYFQARNAVILLRRHGMQFPRFALAHALASLLVALKILLTDFRRMPAFFRGFVAGWLAPSRFSSSDVLVPPSRAQVEARSALLVRAAKS